MENYVALLRGINVGGNKRIEMAVLRTQLRDAGLKKVKTVLASGNVMFASRETDTTKLAYSIEDTIRKHYGFEVHVIIRTQAEMQAVLANNPFTGDEIEGRLLLVNFCREAPAEEKMASFIEEHNTEEQIHFAGKEIYVYYPDGQAKSKLTNNIIERKLDVISTGRNLNTVEKLR